MLTTDASSRTSTMRQLAHQVWKDVRLLRDVLLAWVVLNLALHAVVLAAAASWTPSADAGDRLVIMFRVLTSLNLAGFVTVTVLVVQADPATTSGAFWLTRPVSPWLLLASKFTVLAGLVVLVPVVTDVLTVLAAGLRPPIAALVQSLVLQLLWLLPVMALASFTSSLAQFVVACVIEILGYLLLVTVLTWTLGFTDPLVKERTIEALFAVGVLVASAAVLVVSYGLRSFRWAAAAAAVAPIALCLTIALWPPADWARSNQDHSPRSGRPADHATVPLTVGARYSLAGARNEVLEVDAQADACDVLVRKVSTYPERSERGYSATLINQERGEQPLPLAGREVYLSPFPTLVLPLPQHVAVAGSRLHFQWVPRDAIELREWVEGATLVVEEKR